MKKVKKRSPSGRVSVHVKREKPSIAKCANCKSLLHGIPRLNPSEIKKLSKSKRRPERPYGGYLCSNCSREIFREIVRR